MNKTIKVLFFDDGKCEERLIDNSLESMQSLVHGYIETHPIGRGLYLVCDEEGKLKTDAVVSVMVVGYSGITEIVNPCFIASVNGAEFDSLSDVDIAWLKSRYKYSDDMNLGVLHIAQDGG